MSKKKKNKKNKKAASKKSKMSALALVLSVNTNNGWEVLFDKRISKEKPVSKQEFDMFFDVSDIVLDQIKDGGRLKKSLKIKMELADKAKVKKKKKAKKNSKKKDKSKKTKGLKAKSKPKKGKSVAAKPESKVRTVKKKTTSEKQQTGGAALSKAKTGLKRTPKIGTKRKVTSATKKTTKAKAKGTTKRAAAVRRGRKPRPAKVGFDDLKKIKGIGAKMEKILNGKGIKTYAALSKVGVRELQGIINSAGGYYQSYKPDMWKSEARLAKAGKFDQMQKGRR